MSLRTLIVGGGIGGLAAALALSRAGHSVTVLERASELGEIGAGLQCSPNAMRRLHHWGLHAALARVGAFPNQLQVFSADSGATLGTLPLGAAMQARYGALYTCLHRADLHTALLDAAHAAGVNVLTDQAFESFAQLSNGGLSVKTLRATFETDALIGADGLRSALRQQWLGDGLPNITGHVVYRALIAQSELPAAQRSTDIRVWLGANVHVVAYPVRAGDYVNVAAIVHGNLPHDSNDWNQAVHAASVHTALQHMCTPLNELVHALSDWRAWNVYDRAPVASASQMARGSVALLGDAAHPMRPYMAQGAAMAIEDAAALAQAMQQHSTPAAAFKVYAQARWARNARVQARAARNGQLFHASGLLRQARDMGMRVLGARVLDVPWLYGG